MKNKFIGFSTVNKITGPYTLTDFELVKQDLYNAFFTRPRERIMDPMLGCRIWDLIFDQNDSVTTSLVGQEIERIVSFEPRVSIVTYNVEQLEYGLKVDLLLDYMNITQDYLYLEFTKTLRD